MQNYTINNLIQTNFQPLDFFKSITATKNGIDNLAEFEALEPQKKQELLLNGIHLANRMQKLRDLINEIYKNKIGSDIVIVISSAYRCEKLNKLVKSKPTSQHLKFQACDFSIPKLKEIGYKEVIKELKKAKFETDQMLMEGSWIHYSCKLLGNRNMFGTYLLEKGERVFRGI